MLLLSSLDILFSFLGDELKQQANEAVDAAKDTAETAVQDTKEAGMFIEGNSSQVRRKQNVIH